jgi:hypothetical protein
VSDKTVHRGHIRKDVTGQHAAGGCGCCTFLLYFGGAQQLGEPAAVAAGSPDTKHRRLLVFPFMMQYRRDLPGRIIFTIGVAMSSTCVVLILILWVGDRQ